MILFSKTSKNKRYIGFARLVALITVFAVSVGAQTQRTLTPCWSLDEDGFSTSSPASDNESSVFVKSDGSVVSINNADGSRNWVAELSGDTDGKILSQNDLVFVTANFSKNDRIESFLTIARSSSGVPLSRKSVPGVNSLTVEQDEVFLTAENGRVASYSALEGKTNWTIETKTKLTGGIAVSDSALFVSTIGNTIVRLNRKNGNIETQFNTGDVVSRIFVSKNRIFAGTVRGKMLAFDHDGTKVWETWSGGGISQIELIEGIVLFSSKDNFIYGLSVYNGKKKWKRKLAGRILGSAVVDKELAAYVTTGSTTILLINQRTGSIDGKYEVKNSFVGSPVIIPNGFAVTTTKGIKAFRIDNCGK